MLERDLVYPHLLRRRAQMCPDKIYLRRVEGGELTYGAFYRESLRWADALSRLGVGAEEPLAVFLPNGLDAALLFAASGWLRARFTAINTAYRGRLLEHVFGTARPRQLVIAARYLPQLTSIDLAQTTLESVVVVDAETPADLPGIARTSGRAAFLAGAEEREFAGPDYWDIASIIYTSGTTGPSKGVLVHWAQLHATSADGSLDELGPDACWFAPFPMFHVSGQSSLYKMALAGGSVLLREVLSLISYFDEIERFGVTGSVLLESMIPLLRQKLEAGFRKPPALKYFMLVPVPDAIDRLKALLDVRIGTMYNMTEISGPISSNGFHVDDGYAGSAGYARPGYELRIVDEHDEPVPTGEVGELIVRADQPWVLSGGYLGDAAATVKAWRNGWFHTGDAFRCDGAGRYFFVDRLKDSIRRRGENVSSLEVESEILAHPAVMECAVVAARDALDQEEVMAFLVLKPRTSLEPAELIEFLRARLPHFMIPRFIEFISDLPRTPSQKIEKHVLRSRGIAPNTWDREQHGIVISREA